MKVTSTTVTIANNSVGKKFKGWAKIVLDGKLMVNGIRMFEDPNRIEGKDNRYILFPDRKPPLNTTGGEHVSIPVVNTNDEELRIEITNAVFAAYDKHPKNPANIKKAEA